MEVLPIDVFGVGVDVPYPAPLGFKSAQIEEFAMQICQPKTGLGLKPDHLRLRKFDELFDWELKAHFFGENGNFSRTSERAKISIRNARTAGDWNIIHQTLVRFYTLCDFDPESISVLSTHAHAQFPSPEEREDFLDLFAHGPGLLKAAALGYVEIADWEKEIRVLIEPSNVVPNGIFIAWDTQFPNEQDWDSFLSSLPTMMENAANLFELGFEPLREKV